MMKDTVRRLGIIAGGGQFPRLLATAARNQGIETVAAGFRSDTDPKMQDCVDTFQFFYLGQFRRLIRFFQKAKVDGLVFAGGISKPRALDLRPDWLAGKILFRLRQRGDDKLLGAVIAELEQAGLPVLSSADFLPDLRVPEGILSTRQPNEDELGAIQYGWPLLLRIGELDIGQCLVVKKGCVVAVEGIDGTDATILRAGETGGPGCVVLKCCKPGQDERVDLPSIGLTTIENMIQAKATCLAVQAEKTLFFDSVAALRLAASKNISIVGVTAGDNDVICSVTGKDCSVPLR